MGEVIPPDYDDDPGRFLLARSVQGRYGPGSDVHQLVAARLIDEQLLPVLDVGCGEGELARFLPAGAWYGLDSSPTMLKRAPRSARLGDARALPWTDASFASVAALYVLYHLPEPRLALAEAHRVLRPGGLLAVAAPSRDDSPELAGALGRPALTFDAEIAADMLGELFAHVELLRWDAPMLTLPSTESIRDYLIGKGVDAERARAWASASDIPLTVTKRGAVAYARKA
jgi:SAM-dependent methyltransferase